MSLDLNELAGGGKSWSPELGDKISGTILNVKRVQQTGFDDGKPLEWEDGTPRMQTVIELQTDLKDSDDDDGIRAVWLKGGKNFEPAEGNGASGEVALFNAAKDAKASSVEEGAKLHVACTGMAKPTSRNFRPAKLYTMKYEAPTSSVSVDDLFAD